MTTTLVYVIISAFAYTLFFLFTSSWQFNRLTLPIFQKLLIYLALGVFIVSIVMDILITEIRVRTGTKTEQINLDISTNGIHVQHPNGDNTVKWSGIRRIRQNSSHIFLYITDVAAYIVPKRAFESVSSVEKFITLADMYHSEASNK
ncbi:MAG: YcxB family protein [Caldilineaceae bacterium]